MFFAFGNHEKDFLKHYGINLQSVIERYRDDIVTLGYNESIVHIDNLKSLERATMTKTTAAILQRMT